MTEVDGVFRREWGSAVAAIARWSGDLDVAEDAVAEAFAEALRTWPRDGPPERPGAWVIRVARNRALDRMRRESTRPRREVEAALDGSWAAMDSAEVQPVRDDELRMMFTCAHPALEPASQLALTLRLISGLTVPEIARALLQSEDAVARRISRAKGKIRGARIPLRVPPLELLPERTPHVLACIYSVFTEGYWSTAGRRRFVTTCATRAFDLPTSCARSYRTLAMRRHSRHSYCYMTRVARRVWTPPAHWFPWTNKIALAGTADG
jgi:RNA polymerase sigma-70 factor (ECF subfamily)